MSSNTSRFNQSQRLNSSSAFNKKRLPYNHNNFMISSSRASGENDRNALHKTPATMDVSEASQQAAAAAAQQ